MDTTGFITLLIMAVTFFISYKGFKNHAFYERHAFSIDKVLLQKDYKVLVTSGFLHVSWMHLLFNMIALYFFAEGLENYLGPFKFLLIYFVSMIGGNLFSLFVHRNHSDYKSVGASGAVNGLIFASIALFPGMSIFFIPAWLYGLIYVLYSIYGIRSRADNIGHEAHLAGALIGMITAIIMSPEALSANYFAILLILVPSMVFIYIILRKPSVLMVDNQFYRAHYTHTIDDRYNIAKHNKQKELDRILEKIHRKGMNSLTRKEKDFLQRQK
jgi:membrane associated rhomboid family serine protease